MKNLLIILYISVAYIPILLPYGALDSVYTELYYLSVIQLICSTILIVFNKNLNYNKLIRHPLTLLIIIFLLWSLFTIVPSFNKTEGFVDWYKNCLFYLSFLNISILYRNINNKNLFFFTILFLLFLESGVIFYRFLKLYSFENPPNRAYPFVGFTSNLNVAAYSILVKLPFAFYILLKRKSKFLFLLASILISISIFDILIISSRSAILSLIVVITLLSTLFFFMKRNNLKKYNRSLSYLIIISIVSFLIHKGLYLNSETISIDKRLTSFNFEDPRSSSSFRLGFYLEALEGFLDKPFFGYGIGNWKIFSIQYGSERIREYQIPYHVHNDFLQILVETGLLGGIIYFLIYLLPVIILLKKIFDKKNENLVLDFSILLAFLVFIFDSSFNFPRARAISMTNMIFIYSYFLNSYEINIKHKFFKKLKKGKLFLILNIGLSTAAVFIFFKLYKNSVQQVVMLQDFNITRYFERDLNEIKAISHNFPTLTHTGLPISSAKANYYFYQGQKEKARNLYILGNRLNPFLGDSDIGLAKLYLAEEEYDSAYYYSKRALKKLPYNQLHIAYFQKILLNKDGDLLEEADSVFNKIKDLNVKALWENHLLLVVKFKHADSFNSKDKELAKTAIKKFPNSKNILTAEKLINNKKEIIVLANQYDALAIDYFKTQKYQEAIDNWELAKGLIPDEDAYYLNIAQSYNGLGLFDFALQELKKVEKKNIVEQTGKIEFLKAVAYLGLENNTQACKNFRISAEKGYKLSKETYQKLNCRF